MDTLVPMNKNDIINAFIAKNGRPPEYKNDADRDAIWRMIRDEHWSKSESFPVWCWNYEVKSVIIGYWKEKRKGA